MTPTTSLVGVAIEIPEPWAQELSSWRRKVGDPRAESFPPHVTILPPTRLAAAALAQTEAHLAAVAAAHRGFELRLAGTGTFRPVSDVVFVAVAGGAAQCARLADDVRAGPLHRGLDFPYHPHVTVAHAVPDEALDRVAEGLGDFAARFPVPAFSVYTCDGDQGWRRRRTFALAAATRA